MRLLELLLQRATLKTESCENALHGHSHILWSPIYADIDHRRALYYLITRAHENNSTVLSFAWPHNAEVATKNKRNPRQAREKKISEGELNSTMTLN